MAATADSSLPDQQAAPSGQSAIVTERQRAQTNLAQTMQQIAKESGRPIGQVLRDHIKTTFGKGKLSFDEYVALKLFDAERYQGADLSQFVGLRAMRPLWYRANYRIEFYDVIRNKIAMSALLDAYGLPVIPMRALFSRSIGLETAKCLHSVETLRGFLTNPENYPLFGKPKGGIQSLGSMSILRYDEGTKSLVATDGSVTPLDAFINDVAEHYDDGYIFQPRISPPAETKALCGDRLATVRVVTLVIGGKPEIWRVCEKMPGGANVADNYWHPGNMLVRLDPANGTRLSAVTGAGLGLRDVERHPDSGSAIKGTRVPNWDVVCNLALEGARVFPDAALIGWDIAPVEGGALIVEANVTPDPFLPQLADRRGLLDERFNAFLAERDRMAKEWKQYVQKHDFESYKPSFFS